jgi:phospho-N-acetylmuramoyl-pentapeptide-transferase
MLPLLLGVLLAFGGVVLLAPTYIRLLQRLGFGKAIRAEGPASHAVKAGTPTMGGMLIIVVVMFLAMAMGLEDESTLIPMLALVGVGILGAFDDYVNIRTGFGVHGRYKLIWQTIVSILAAVYIQRHFDITAINVPLVGEITIGAVGVVAFVAFAIVAMSNAVNLTDGLDGLASGLLVFSFIAYLLIAMMAVPGMKLSQPELAVFCALLIGALMGFLWFNVHPAQIFIGDAGALSMGATLAVVATVTGQLLLLVVIGIVFVAVTLSVIIQVASYKTRGKRIFRMTPLQHHFELLGWAEEKITLRFWIVAALAALLGFSLFLASTGLS